MYRLRFSIAAMMAVVAVMALMIAALRFSSAAWAGAMLLLVWGVLGLAIAGALSRKGGERAWWVGFALFGCGYLALAMWSERNFKTFPTTTVILYLGSKFAPSIQQSSWFLGGSPEWTFLQIAHCLWALLAATLGAAVVRVLFGSVEPDREPPYLPARWWRRPAVIWLSGSAIVAAAALAGSRAAPGLWAGGVFLLTCGMLGLATLGAAVCRAPRRTIWLGAALFGGGYMVLTFGRSAEAGWIYPPTTHLLNALRSGALPHWSGFPDASDRNNALNESILRALEQPIPMHFPQGEPLEDVLKHIKAEAETRVGRKFPIYVDPISLQSVRKTMVSTVQIDMEGAALKNSLAHCLRQLDLTYCVKDGFLMVNDIGPVLPVFEDPFLIVGHCLLALLAAALGGALAPLVADARSR